MSITGTSAAWVDIEVDGAPLNPLVLSTLVSAEVHTTLFVPSQFRLVFRAPSLEVLELGALQLASEVALQITSDLETIPLMLGEVTAVEIDYGPDGNLTVVRGLDHSHRLMRGNQTMAYPEMTASDVVTALIGEAGLEPGEIVPTTTLYPWLTQANVTAWAFIKQLCALENYVAYVDTLGLFCFGPTTAPEEGTPPAMTYETPALGAQLILGKNLLRLRAVVSAAEQVPEVTVTGWDPTMAMPVVGVGPGLPSTSQSLDPGVLPVTVAGEFEAKPLFDASRPFDTVGAAEKRAEAIAAEIAGSLAELEGQCEGDPQVIAGQAVSLGMAGAPFDGSYLVTSARHVFETALGGYTTWFTVGGRQDRSMLALAAGATAAQASRPEIPGVVVATVLDNADPEDMGRVKVSFPWLDDAYISAWAPTVQLSASASFGSLWLPEIDDQVLIGFDRGNIDYPYVIGHLYNGVNRPEPAPQVEGVVGSRRIMSRARHMIQFNDGPEQLGITIVTGDETCSITIDAEEQSVSVVSAGQVSVEAVEAISVKTGADITFEAGGSLSLTATGGVSITSGGAVSVETDAAFSVDATSATIESPTVSISGAEISLGA